MGIYFRSQNSKGASCDQGTTRSRLVRLGLSEGVRAVSEMWRVGVEEGGESEELGNSEASVTEAATPVRFYDYC